MNESRIIVVGAGPAGTRAAQTLAAYRRHVVVVDESPRSGGQIYRRPPEGFTRSPQVLYGFEAAKAQRLHAAFDALEGRIDHRPETLVWNVSRGVVHTLRDGTRGEISFDALILATGAMDRAVPFSGWTMPGVFTLGGAQVALKHQGCAVGRRVAFVGTGPLLYLVARQYARAGGGVTAVIDSSPAAAKRRAFMGLAAGRSTLVKGLWYVAALRFSAVPVFEGALPMAVTGAGRVEGLRFRDGAGHTREVACDAVATGYGLRSETQIADLCGCDFAFDATNRQWLPDTDADGRSSVEGVYLAGDGAGIAGADAAELRGELAALALLADQGETVDERRIATLRRDLGRIARFRAGLEAAFPFPAALAAAVPHDTPLCRCEAVTAGELRAAVRDLGASEMNRAKAFTRLGMGRCQGRVCGAAAAEVLAAALDKPVEEVGRLRGQAPVKPLPLAAREPD